MTVRFCIQRYCCFCECNQKTCFFPLCVLLYIHAINSAASRSWRLEGLKQSIVACTVPTSPERHTMHTPLHLGQQRPHTVVSITLPPPHISSCSTTQFAVLYDNSMWVSWYEPWRCPQCGNAFRMKGWPKPGELPKSGNVTCTFTHPTEHETVPTDLTFHVQSWADGWFLIARAVCDPPSVCSLAFRKDEVVFS